MATADWTPLGEVYYRKTELYLMDWYNQVDLSKYMVAAAPFGGPVALIRDDSKRLQTTKPVLYIYNAAGREVKEMRWTSGILIQIGWTCTEDLLCIQEDGVVLVYDIFGCLKKTFGLGQEAKDVKVKDCKIFQSFQGTGIAILTSTFRIFLVNNIEDPRIRRLAEVPGLQSAPTCWTILNLDRQAKALVANGAELFLVDHGGQYEQKMPQVSQPFGSFIDITVSMDNNFVVLFTDTGLIWVGSADFQTVCWEFTTKSATKPTNLSWCDGAVVACWGNLMVVIGPDKYYIKLDSPVYLVQEVDGVRIIGNMQHELLQRVPDVTEKVLKTLSMAPGAMLRQASREYQKRSQNADEHIRMIERLDIAVDQCIQAAGNEIEPSVQRELLRAASFGKGFLTDYQPNTFRDMCRTLRVLNQVRQHTIGIPITYTQLELLTMPVLIDRLVLRKEFLLAIRICESLHIPDAEGVSRILAHWACYKVQQKYENDETVAQEISQKLGDTPGVSYSEIASKAIECGRKQLAIRLLDFESKASEQVPLLMKMDKNELALSKAIDSGDTDLVYTVLLKLKENSSAVGDFSMQIRNMPVAHSLYLQYCRQQNRVLLRKLYYQEDNYMEEGNCHVVDSYSEERLEDRLSILKDSFQCYTKARNEFATRQTEEQIKLIKFQTRLEEELNHSYVDLSLHQTMHKLIKENQNKYAEMLRKDFKVSDKRYWLLRMNALAEADDWVELEKFSRIKKQPVGMEAFVEVCMKYKNRFEAKKYLPRVLPENRVRCLLKTGQLKEAADAAFENRNEDELNFVLARCGAAERQLAEAIRNMKSQLTYKK